MTDTETKGLVVELRRVATALEMLLQLLCAKEGITPAALAAEMEESAAPAVAPPRSVPMDLLIQDPLEISRLEAAAQIESARLGGGEPSTLSLYETAEEEFGPIGRMHETVPAMAEHPEEI
jgi:hypothetical protein